MPFHRRRWYDDYYDAFEEEEEAEEFEDEEAEMSSLLEDDEPGISSSSEDETPSGSGPKSSSSSVLARALRRRMRYAIAEIEAGPYADANTVPNAPNPGIFIEGLGIIGLPLSDRDAEAIRLKCNQRDGEKLDRAPSPEDVSSKWEIDPTQFELRNPAWRTLIDELTLKVRQSLKFTCSAGNTEARIHKMLLYDAGAFSGRHRDGMELGPGVFGKMVICLSTAHEGGDIHLSYDERTLRHRTSESSAFGVSYAAWYGDVEYEVKPVISGHRLVIEYNLVQVEPSYRQTPFSLSDEGSRLTSTFEKWSGIEDNSPSALAYVLDHTYSDSDLRIEKLEGKDASAVYWLENACKREGFSLVLANMETVVEGSDEDSEHDSQRGSEDGSDVRHGGKEGTCYKKNHFLTFVTDLNEQKIAGRIALHKYDLVQKRFEYCVRHEDRGPSRNGGANAVARQSCRNSCAVFILGGRLVEFYLRKSELEQVPCTASKTMHRLMAQLKEEKVRETARGEIKLLCSLMVADRTACARRMAESGKLEPHHDMADVILAALEIDEMKIFDPAVQLASNKELMKVWPEISRATTRWGFKLLQQCIKLAFNRLESFDNKWKALEILGDELMHGEKDSEDIKKFEIWRDETYGKFLSMAELRQSSASLAKIAIACGTEVLLKRIIPLLTNGDTKTAVRVSFLVNYVQSALQKIGEGQLDVSIVRGALGQVLELMQGRFRVSTKPTTSHLNTWSTRRSEKQIEPTLSGSELVDLIHTYPDLDPTWTANRLCKLISSSIPEATVEDFENVLLPVVTYLTEQAGRDPRLPEGGETCGFVVHTLYQYTAQYVGKEPYPQTSWARQIRSGCHGNYCHDCQEIDRFMKDPHKQTVDFLWGKPRRKHIERSFNPGSHNDHYVQEVQPTPQYCGLSRTAMALRVTKTRRKHEEWEKRFELASRRICEIQSRGPLDKLLGKSFEDVMNLRAVRLPVPPPFSKGLPTSNESTTTEAAATTATNREPLRPLASQPAGKRPLEGDADHDGGANPAGRKNPTGFGAFQKSTVDIIDLT